MLTSSFKLFFFERSSFKLRCEAVIGIVLCYSHQACCLLYYLRDINSAIPMHQYRIVCFTTLFSDVVVVSDLNKTFGGSTDLVEKKARIGGFVYPYSRPSLNSRFTENKISQSRIKRILLYDPLEGPQHHTSSDQSPPGGGYSLFRV